MPVETADPPAYRIHDERQVVGLLRQLADGRTLLGVTLDGRPGPVYQSAVVGVEPRSRLLEVDELVPAEGHARVRPGIRLDLRGRLQGVPLRFAGVVDRVQMVGDIAVYRLPMPAWVDYRQRRSGFRAPVSRAPAVPVSLADGDESWEGELSDISVGGFAVRLAGTQDDLRGLDGGRVLDCRIELPGQAPLQARVEARHLRGAHSSTGAVLGTRFLVLDRAQSTCLERFIAALERDLSKRRLR